MNNKEFDKLYYACFDKDDNIMFCGREACKSLLRFVIDTTGKKTKYGDITTGKLNIAEIVNLHKSGLN